MVLLLHAGQVSQLSSLVGFKACHVRGTCARQTAGHLRSGFTGASSGVLQPTPSTACSALSVLRPAGDLAHTAVAVAPLDHDQQQHVASLQHRPVGSELGWPADFDAHYVVGSFLGAGSYGVCHEAVHIASGRVYAVKSLLKERPNAPRARTIRRLRREAALLERLAGSGNVVQLVDKFETPESVYFVLELCHGADLQELLLERGSLDERTAARVVFECLRVLKACHAAGVVHNDVKPGNFMVDATRLDGVCAQGWAGECSTDMPVLKLLDFGCSQRLKLDGTPLSKRTGTPVYMAPEVYYKEYTELADVWSLGMMMHQLLTGRFPFWSSIQECLASSVNDVMNSVLYADLDVAKAGVDNRFSPECADLLKHMLVRDPAQRITVDQALEHPWFARYAPEPCECGHHGLSPMAAPMRTGGGNNIVPFPSRAPVASALPAAPEVQVDAQSGTSTGSDDADTAVAVWALMQAGSPFSLAL